MIRFNSEKDKLIKKWGEALCEDPYYNINLTRSEEDFSLRFSKY